MSVAEFQKVAADIGRKKFAPLYFLTGDEPYYIDQLSDLIENSVLIPDERAFNQSVVYGADVTVPDLISMARRYPAFAAYQVVIVREAQQIDNIETLVKYAENPVPTTVLVLCYKYQKLDKRTTFAKHLQSKGVFFESKKLYEDKIPDWITAYMKEKGYRIDQKAALLLAEYTGNELGNLSHEIQKLMINLPPETLVTSDHIAAYTGISKEFNVFELQKALGERNVFRVNQVAFYMAANPKENPILKIIPVLFSFFSKLLLYHALVAESRRPGGAPFDGQNTAQVAKALGVHPFFASDYVKAAKNYSFARLSGIVSQLRIYDMRAKGVDNDSTEDSELIREMLYRIMH
ncbi:MAG TPA: DNA polymerase III subunit delta [Bacteroidales bacterium]|nr:DNA polymerase III subunit delta [Bacteroidales bacterium]HSA43437.1 DNA polymerase III subunit delta [Bacteroidales bacterium]